MSARKPCPHCGFEDTFGLDVCPKCDQPLNQPYQEEQARPFLFQFVPFLLVLGFVLYPYLKKQFPALEKKVDPGAYTERQADRLFEQKQYKEAIKRYKTSLTQGTLFSKRRGGRERGMVHYKLALCHVYLKQSALAIKHGEAALKAYPSWRSPLAYQMLLYLYSVGKQEAKIDALAKRYKKKFGKGSQTYIELGNSYGRIRSFQKALALYKEGLKKYPKHPALLGGYAWTIALDRSTNKKQLKHALTYAERANKLTRGKRFAILNTLAELHMRLGDTKKALSYAKEGVKRALRRHKKVAKMRLKSLQHAAMLGAFKHAHRRPAPPRRSTPASRPTTVTALAQPRPASRPASKPTVRLVPLRKIPRLRFPPVPIPKGKAHRRSRRLLAPPQ